MNKVRRKPFEADSSRMSGIVCGCGTDYVVPNPRNNCDSERRHRVRKVSREGRVSVTEVT